MQNDVIAPGGAFADSGAPAHAEAQGAVANCVRLAERCRARGIPVIHVWLVCKPGHPALRTRVPLFEGPVAANALVRGTWGVAPVPGLEPRGGDLVVEKMTTSAWESGRLGPYLKGAQRDVILNAGAWTNMSVEHTARTGADKGYRVVTVEDACATVNAAWHRASIDFAMTNLATIARTEEVLAQLRETGRAETGAGRPCPTRVPRAAPRAGRPAGGQAGGSSTRIGQPPRGRISTGPWRRGPSTRPAGPARRAARRRVPPRGVPIPPDP